MSTPDLAPSLPSRIVRGRSTEITERGPIKGGTVTFGLSQAILSVPDKTYLEASSVTVPLDANADGTWEVRLPTVSANVEPRDSWTLTVKYSTRPYPFQIRVPAGTGPIDIADIGEVHGVAPEHAGWVVTGMQIGTVTTGPASARISGQAPTLTLDLTIPKGEKGDPGAGIAVLGTKATTADLPTGAKVGDAYLVGANLHVWNGTAWTNTGPLRGPTGAPGATPQLSAKAVTLSPTQAATASVAGPAGTPELTIGVPRGRDGASITKVEQTGGQSADVIITDPNTGQTTRTTILLPAGTATFDEVQEDIWEAGSGGEGLVTAEQLIESLAGKADTTDPRLSDARTPTAHRHDLSDVDGLQDALGGKGEPGPPGRGIVSISDPDADSRVTITFTDDTTATVQAIRGVDGHTPVITWDGTTIVTDGTPGPDLKGEPGEPGDPGPASTVPGPAGPPGAVPVASDYLVVGPGRPDAPTTTGMTSEALAALPVGCEYRSTDGASVGAWVWRKRPTGWVVTQGDTGWVTLTDPDVWASGGMMVRRVDSTLYWKVGTGNYGLFRWSAEFVNGAVKVAVVPAPFCPQGTSAYITLRTDGGNKGVVGAFEIQTSGTVVRRTTDNGTLTSDALSGPTSNPWPTTLTP